MSLLHYFSLNVFVLLAILALNDASSDLDGSAPLDRSCVDYCFNNGICVMDGDGPKCYCLSEWTGRRCNDMQEPNSKETLDSFKRAPTNSRALKPCPASLNGACKNDATCYLFNDNQLICLCAGDYAGDLCEVEGNCPADFCSNGGTCVPGAVLDSIPTCMCAADFTGRRCQTDVTATVDVCKFLPSYCQNGGTCQYVGSVRCVCPSTHMGSRCEIPAVAISSIQPTTIFPGQSIASPVVAIGTCASNPCRNGRPCYNTGNSYYCYCGSQYTGTLCEQLASG